MAEPKKILEKAYNSLSKFNDKLEELALVTVYGKDQSPTRLVNFADQEEKRQVIKAIGSIKTNPSLENIHSTLQVINTYDVCNPLMFAVSQVFPPGSEVSNLLNGAQSGISEIVNKFRAFNIIEGTQEVSAIASPTTFPFKIGKIELVVPRGENVITKGSYITITQTDDPKVSSSMRGTVDSVTNTINGNSYTINVDSISPGIPPYQKDNRGNTIQDESGQPIPAEYSNFKIEYQSLASSNVQELSQSLIELTTSLQELGVNDIANQINSLPTTLPGVSGLKSGFKDVLSIVEEIGTVGAQAADVTGTTGQALAGNLRPDDIFDRVRVLRDFYNKILPFTNITFAIQEVFKKQIESVNNTLRNAIPYDQIAQIIRVVVFLSRAVLGIINTIITFLNVVNTIIKTISTVLKVIRVVLKVIKAVIKILPALFVPVGAIETVTNFINKIEAAITRGIDLLDKISQEIQAIINTLGWVKTYLQLVIAESVKFASKLESCNGFNNSGLQEASAEASRNNFIALKNLLSALPALDKFQAGQNGSTLANTTGATTFVVIDGYGTIMPLRDSVFGFDENGNIVFYGDLTSLSTGVSFEDTLGQDFRSKLQYYTFNKFKNSQRPLIEAAENLFNERQEIIADPEDRFGNFQELYLGYTIKIQEDKPTDQNQNTLIRRRGIALDSNEKIVASTDLTFGDNLELLVNEIKYKLNLYLNQGIIGINTADSSPNQISDSDAVGLAEDIGINPIGANNVKAEANNRAASNITPKLQGDIEGRYVDPSQPTETRIGGAPFSPEDNTPAASSVSGKASANKSINMDSLVTPLLNKQKEQNPEFKAIQDIFDTLGSINPAKVSQILNKPGSENMSDEELLSTLKAQVLSSMDPNPDKVEELKRKTAIWYEGLRKKTKIDWEQLTLNYKKPKDPVPPYEDYYDQIEGQELPKWIKLLTRQRYTETEIQYGIDDVRIRDKYQFKFGPNSSVEVILRPAFKKRN